jgi:hypothetical protein
VVGEDKQDQAGLVLFPGKTETSLGLGCTRLNLARLNHK